MSSGFVSENELAERRRLRQEEWEKVRKPDQPLEVPEDPYDHRSLYERLEEQRQKKQLEYEEAHRLKNMIKGLDDDEVEFLDLVDQKKLEAEHLKELEEEKELLDFRKKVEQLKETTLDQRIHAEIQPAKSNSGNRCEDLENANLSNPICFSSGIKSQNELLKGVVVKKRFSDGGLNKYNENELKNKTHKNECCGKKRKSEEDSENISHMYQMPRSGLTCVGILPGLGSYVESSDDSDHSSSTSETNDDRKYDLTGRRIIYKSKDDPE